LARGPTVRLRDKCGAHSISIVRVGRARPAGNRPARPANRARDRGGTASSNLVRSSGESDANSARQLRRPRNRRKDCCMQWTILISPYCRARPAVRRSAVRPEDRFQPPRLNAGSGFRRSPECAATGDTRQNRPFSRLREAQPSSPPVPTQLWSIGRPRCFQAPYKSAANFWFLSGELSPSGARDLPRKIHPTTLGLAVSSQTTERPSKLV
jgi:hypothetical protein